MLAIRFVAIAFCAALCLASPLRGIGHAEGAADIAIPERVRLAPAALAETLKHADTQITILQVGSSVLFAEAHIAGAQYAGPTAKPEGLQNLVNHVDHVSRDQLIVIYCGCCPWSRCPNIGPAYSQLRSMGFSNVRALYLPDNFGDDWVNKGYPTAHGS